MRKLLVSFGSLGHLVISVPALGRDAGLGGLSREAHLGFSVSDLL